MFAIERDQVALFMEMRLGKSLVAERWLRAKLPKQGRALIVSPLSAIPDWIETLRGEGHDPTWIRGNEEDRQLLASNRRRTFFLINPALITPYGSKHVRIPKLLMRESWDAVVLDESTMIRNPRAMITRVVQSAFRSVPLKAVLTGLPNPASALDYFEQLCFLQGEFMGCSNYWQWRHRYFRVDWTGFGWFPKPGTIALIKTALQENCFQLSRAQAGVGPNKIFKARFLSATPDQKRLHKQALQDFQAGNRETKSRLTVELWLQQIAGGFHPEGGAVISDAKLREIEYLLSTELKGQRVVIWFAFNAELHYVQEALRAKKWRTASITGETDPDSRASIRKLLDLGEIQVLLAQLRCVRFGVNFSSADTGIYYSNVYDLEIRRQSEDRQVHMKRKDPILLIDLVTEGSADQAVREALRDKKITASIFGTRIWKELLK